MSANSGWYPDPGGAPGLYRYWDGRAWSAALSPNPAAPAPAPSLGSAPAANPTVPSATTRPTSAQQPSVPPTFGPQAYGQGGGNAYANYQAQGRSRSAIGWWIGAAALLVVIVVVAVVAIRGFTGAGGGGNPLGGQPTSAVCPREQEATQTPLTRPNDGRVHGGPLSYPTLGTPWGSPRVEYRVPFGNDVMTQSVTVESNYEPGQSWVASVLVGELQAGDGFFTPEQGSQIVVRCILGRFYGDNEVRSDVKVNRATTIDGHEAWVIESQLSFDIENLKTKGELLIVAIVANGPTAGLFYASIPDTRPELVQPSRDALAQLEVDG